MDRDRLRAYLDEGLSLDHIGAIEGKHASTVSYWLGKFGLEANGKARHAPRGGIDEERLAVLVGQGLTLREIAAELGFSMTAVRYWIRRYDLETPRKVRRREVRRALAEGRRTLMKECRSHGRTTFVIENSGRLRCRQCRMDAVTRWRRRAKARLVEEAGGRCVPCGYEECQAALQFHHLDPAEKAFDISNAGVPRSIEVLREETAKCVLLCGNRHAAVEAGYRTL